MRDSQPPTKIRRRSAPLPVSGLQTGGGTADRKRWRATPTVGSTEPPRAGKGKEANTRTGTAGVACNGVVGTAGKGRCPHVAPDNPRSSSCRWFAPYANALAIDPRPLQRSRRQGRLDPRRAGGARTDDRRLARADGGRRDRDASRELRPRGRRHAVHERCRQRTALSIVTRFIVVTRPECHGPRSSGAASCWTSVTSTNLACAPRRGRGKARARPRACDPPTMANATARRRAGTTPAVSPPANVPQAGPRRQLRRRPLRRSPTPRRGGAPRPKPLASVAEAEPGRGAAGSVAFRQTRRRA